MSWGPIVFCGGGGVGWGLPCLGTWVFRNLGIYCFALLIFILKNIIQNIFVSLVFLTFYIFSSSSSKLICIFKTTSTWIWDRSLITNFADLLDFNGGTLILCKIQVCCHNAEKQSFLKCVQASTFKRHFAYIYTHS